MSKSLIKLIEYSLMPAALLVLGKAVGIFVAIRVLNIPLSTKEYTNQLFSPVSVAHSADLQLITGFSDTVMFVVVTTFFSVSLVRAMYLHNTHVKPPLVATLVKYNLLGLIQTSYELYHQSFVSLLFVWIATVLVSVNTINQLTAPWIMITVVITTLSLSLGLLYDVYREIEQIKKNPGKYEWI